MQDFRPPIYRMLLECLIEADYAFFPLGDAPVHAQPRTVPAVLRHDVDRLAGRALVLAEIEHELGIPATYFFRTRRHVFDHAVIRKIQELGHEIGYHYECFPDAMGDPARAWRLFLENLERFDFVGGVDVIAMHGRPLSRHDGRDLWNHYDYRDAGIRREAYLDIPWDRYMYLTDTGGTWDETGNIRDHVDGRPNPIGKGWSTRDMADLLARQKTPVVISTHPERWPTGPLSSLQARATDWTANIVKRMISAIRYRQ